MDVLTAIGKFFPGFFTLPIFSLQEAQHFEIDPGLALVKHSRPGLQFYPLPAQGLKSSFPKKNSTREKESGIQLLDFFLALELIFQFSYFPNGFFCSKKKKNISISIQRCGTKLSYHQKDFFLP